mmetsp:Transcript_11009/g.23615  ORF Transcript_11009/g.23615 Transcript_11009/m.23615 type:complete len:757 (+) Transcript_11009:61-2331(+)
MGEEPSADLVDFFCVLGVPTSASTKDVRQAYLRHARVLHPDKQSGEDRLPAVEAMKVKFQLLNEAHKVLVDPEGNRVYRRCLDLGLPHVQAALWAAHAMKGNPVSLEERGVPPPPPAEPAQQTAGAAAGASATAGDAAQHSETPENAERPDGLVQRFLRALRTARGSGPSEQRLTEVMRLTTALVRLADPDALAAADGTRPPDLLSPTFLPGIAGQLRRFHGDLADVLCGLRAQNSELQLTPGFLESLSATHDQVIWEQYLHAVDSLQAFLGGLMGYTTWVRGTPVEIRGLEKVPALNGRVGSVRAFVSEKMRFAVALMQADGCTDFHIKPSSLQASWGESLSEIARTTATLSQVHTYMVASSGSEKLPGLCAGLSSVLSVLRDPPTSTTDVQQRQLFFKKAADALKEFGAAATGRELVSAGEASPQRPVLTQPLRPSSSAVSPGRPAPCSAGASTTASSGEGEAEVASRRESPVVATENARRSRSQSEYVGRQQGKLEGDAPSTLHQSRSRSRTRNHDAQLGRKSPRRCFEPNHNGTGTRDCEFDRAPGHSTNPEQTRRSRCAPHSGAVGSPLCGTHPTAGAGSGHHPSELRTAAGKCCSPSQPQPGPPQCGFLPGIRQPVCPTPRFGCSSCPRASLAHVLLSPALLLPASRVAVFQHVDNGTWIPWQPQYQVGFLTTSPLYQGLPAQCASVDQDVQAVQMVLNSKLGAAGMASWSEVKQVLPHLVRDGRWSQFFEFVPFGNGARDCWLRRKLHV